MKSFAQSLGKMKQPDISLLKSSADARQVLIELHEAFRNLAVIAGIKLRGQHAYRKLRENFPQSPLWKTIPRPDAAAP